MKTSIKNFITSALTLVVLTSASLVSKADNGNVTVLNDTKKVNTISVAGNVDLILVQSADESVKVYDSYYSKNALVQHKNGELRISSYEKTPLTVVVYVTNLSELNASDNARVRTYGKFSALGLDLNLKDQAKADLNVQAINVNADIKGNADLTLSGYTSEYYGKINQQSKVNLNAFLADSLSIQSDKNAPAKHVNPFDIAIAE